MQDSKKFYWLKLHKDFFKRHDIRIVENMPNGHEYINFYLKLLTESTSHEGELRFSEEIPYSVDMLSVVTNTNIDIVKSAINIFESLRMIDILDDGTIFMRECQKMIGSCSTDDHTRESTRLRVQKHREKQKSLQECYSNVTCNGEIDIEKEKELEIELEIERDVTPKHLMQDVIDRWNTTRLPRVSAIRSGTSRYNMLKARLNEYGIDDVIKAVDNAGNSSFLAGQNNRGWTATFDWFVKPNNFIKVLEGNYTDNEQKKQSIDAFIQEFLSDE